jgi:polyphosphate kinase
MSSGQVSSERGAGKSGNGKVPGRDQARASERERAAARERAARHERAAARARDRLAERQAAKSSSAETALPAPVQPARWPEPGQPGEPGRLPVPAGEAAYAPGQSLAAQSGAARSGAARSGAARARAAQSPAAEPEMPPDRYLDREESWLRFNQRVLELAEDESIPLLERVRFVGIFASNLDEFFMVRVAGRIRRMATGLPVESASGRRPSQILKNTLETAWELSVRHARCFAESILPALAAEGIEVLRWKELTADEQADMQRLFRERVYPVLTPLVVDPAHPFPYISGLSLSLAVMIADPRTSTTIFARVKVPPLLPRFLTVGPTRFVPLEDVIAAHLGELFVGLDVIEQHAFRVTRTRDLEIDEDVTENLMQSLERELTRRRFEPAVRLEVEESISSDVLEKLVTELDIDERAVYRMPGPLDLSGLTAIADLDMPQLKYPAFVPSETVLPRDTGVFSTLTEHDVLVHHPYDSFSATVERLVVSAAADPRVLAIKQTLYRTSGDSEIVDALIDAAEAGKQVVVVVELKARFDERANIAWARKLEEAGCHVVYGFVGLKTHCKMALVVREETDGSLRRFCHIGTGNYHPTTARLYEDFGLLTSDPTVGEDITDLFNHLTGYSRKTEYRRLLVAPAGLRSGLVERIEAQAARARDGKPARIQMKCNSIIDEVIIDALYRASRDGVPIDLWVRGICAVRPGVPGLSETIRVRSVLGRFLEHSRIYAFGSGRNGEDGGVWLGSADLMHRNLDRRVELLVRVTDPAQRAELRGLIDLGMNNGTASWWLGPDGTWTRHHLDDACAPLNDVQDLLIRARTRGRSADA